MTRLSEKTISLAAPPGLLATAPWICSGQLTAAAVVSDGPCRLGAILVEIDDTDQDAVVTVYDSANNSTTGKEVLGIFTANLVAKQNSQLYVFPLPGIECAQGIYITVSGNVKVFVYYR